jgi:hypothetical protein
LAALSNRRAIAAYQWGFTANIRIAITVMGDTTGTIGITTLTTGTIIITVIIARIDIGTETREGEIDKSLHSGNLPGEF